MLIDSHKWAFRALITDLAKDGRKDTSAAILTALGEVTAEVSIGVVGPEMTTRLLLQLIDKITEASQGDGS